MIYLTGKIKGIVMYPCFDSKPFSSDYDIRYDTLYNKDGSNFTKEDIVILRLKGVKVLNYAYGISTQPVE